MALARDEFGRRLRAARERAHLTQQDVADALKVDWRQIQRYDAGKAVPRAARIPELAKVLGVEPSYFEEPLNEHAVDRIDRRVEDNARSLRTVLGLLDELLAEVRTNRQQMLEIVETRTGDIAGRLEDIEARQQAADTALSRVQQEFLQALGAPVPPPATDAGDQATSTRSTKTGGTRPANDR